MSENRGDAAGYLGWFFLGALVGAGVAFILAPKTGEETRELLKEKGSEWAKRAQEVTSQALQIHGAAGYGRSLPLERMVRDARMFAIGGGTLEMMRNLIADHVLPSRADWRRP